MTTGNLYKFSALVAFALLPATSPAFADVIFFKNGRVLEGRILNQNRVSLTIRTSGGDQVVRKSRVRRVRYGALTGAERRLLKTARRREAERIRRERNEARRAAARARTENRIARAEAARLREIALRPERRATGPGTDWRALRMSAMLPGWGQYDQGRVATGAVYAGGILAGGILAAVSFRDFRAARDAYNSLELPGLAANSIVADDPLLALAYQIPFDAARRESLRAHARFRAAGLLMIGLYIWNVAEHFFIGGDVRPLSGRVMEAGGLEFRARPVPAIHGAFQDARTEQGGDVEISWRILF